MSAPSPEAVRFLIANEASGGGLTFRCGVLWGTGWTPDASRAERFETLAAAREARDQLDRERRRAGRRLIVAEQPTPEGPAHRIIEDHEGEREAQL